MDWISVGVEINGRRPKTKAELKRALKEDPDSVYFDTTSLLVTGPGGYSPDDLPGSGIKLSVVGPDPYSARNWYATVEHRNGRLVCS